MNSRSKTGSRSAWVLPLVAVVLVLATWEVLARTGAIPEELSAPSLVAPWLWSEFQDPGFWLAFSRTLFHWIAGLLIATVLGIIVGLAIGMNRTVSKLLQLPIEFLRPIPPVVYLPLLLLLMGAHDGVAYGLAAVGAFWPVMFQTFYGVQSLDSLTRDTGRVFGLSTRQQILYILVPGIAPSVATGIRIAASIALVIAITMEVVGGIPGLGADLRTAQLNSIFAGIFGLTLVMGLIGIALNLGLEAVERRALKWHELYRPRT